MIVKQALNIWVGSQLKKWGYDRSNTVGASEIGGCARKAFFEKNRNTKFGSKPDADYRDGWGARMRGHLIEDYLWVPALRKRFGKNLLFAGKQQQTLFKGYISATPDGLVINQPRDILKEFKLNGKSVADIGPGKCFVVES